jgi:hypothetical protein
MTFHARCTQRGVDYSIEKEPTHGNSKATSTGATQA